MATELSMNRWLEEQDDTELRGLIQDIHDLVPGVREWIEDLMAIHTRKPGPLLRRLDDAIQGLRPPDRAVDIPMWVQSALLGDTTRATQLVKGGQVLELHDELLQRVPAMVEVGIAQTETLYKDDCAGHEVTEILSLILQSLPHAKMSPPERILYADKLVRDDQHGVVPSVAPYLAGCTAEDWRSAASRASLTIDHAHH